LGKDIDEEDEETKENENENENENGERIRTATRNSSHARRCPFLVDKCNGLRTLM
jgi:hypothetical protein